MKEDEFHRGLLRGSSAKTDAHGTLYMKDVTEVFRNQVGFRKKESIVFRPKQRNKLSIVVSPSITTDSILTCYREL